jgi:hypothetical protein
VSADDEVDPHCLSVGVEYSYDHRATLLNGTTELAQGGEFNITTLTVDLEYRLSTGFAARARLPVYWKTFSEPGTPDLSLDGIGDTELSGTLDVARTPRWVATLGVGMALPTGSTTAQPIVGSAVPTPLQLGTGTVDPLILGIVAYRPIRPLEVHLSADARPVLYANGHEYQAASVYSGGIGAEYRALEGRLAPALDVVAAHTTHTAVGGTDVPNTGRDVIYLAPRFAIRLVNALRLEASIRIPVFQEVNATQFGETFGADIRLSYTSRSLFETNDHGHDDHDAPTIAQSR